MEASKLIAQIRKKDLAPVYFLHGEEPYYIDKIANEIEKNALKEEEKGFNQIILYGKDTDIPTIVSNAKRFPMMAERTVVIVKEAQEIKGFARDADQEMLMSYVNNPLPSTVLVFCYKHKKFDTRKKIAKALGKAGTVFLSKKLYDNQVQGWISDEIKSRGHEINPRASFMMAEYIGNNLSRIVNEIDKLVINLEPGKTIDEVMVQRNIGISKDYNIFELQSAIASRNLEKAMAIVNYFAANPKNHPVIMSVTMLFSYFTRVLLANIHQHKSDAELAGEIGVNKFFVKEYRTAVRNFPRHKILMAIEHIHHADLQSKGIGSQNMNDGEILKELVYKILT